MVRSTIFKTNRTQAVRLPKRVAFREGTREVEIIAIGQSRIVTPVGKRWDDLFANGRHASTDFMRERCQPEAEERKPLDRQKAALKECLREKVDEALADPRPNIPAREVFRRLRAHHAAEAKTKK
jgi:antitoxin VapB